MMQQQGSSELCNSFLISPLQGLSLNGHGILFEFFLKIWMYFLARKVHPVIALMFFALFSPPSPSFHPYDFMTLFLVLYPDKPVHSFPFIFSFTRVKEQDKTAHDLHLTIQYWYMRIGIGIVRRTLADPDDPPRILHMNSGASSSPHSHVGLRDGPGSKEPRR